MTDSPIDSTVDPESSELLFAELMNELEKATDRHAVVERYCQQHPDLAPKIRELLAMEQALGNAVGDSASRVPEQLGDLRIVRRIGRGGMGEIYLAEQVGLNNRRVAVKVIRQGRASPSARARFLREQKVLAQLHQTSIVPVHLAGEQDGLQYFVMPYIQGAALHHVIWEAYQETLKSGSTHTIKEIARSVAKESDDNAQKQSTKGEPTNARETASYQPPRGMSQLIPREPIPRDVPVRLSAQYYRSVAETVAAAAEAIQHAHEAGVLHRDIKPSNVMVDHRGQCWLIDFGLAGYFQDQREVGHDPNQADSSEEALTTTGFLGTLQYAAPEQLVGKADVHSDVWGLGATLYELCTLRRAFEGSSEEVRNAIDRAEPTSLRKLAPNVPADLAAICRKALRKNPGDRYTSAGDMARDLRRWLNYEPTRARPAYAVRFVWLWSKRNPGWAGAFLVALVACVLVVTGIIHLEQANAQAARDRARVAEQGRKKQQRESLRQEIMRIRLMPHTAGWSNKTWRKVQEARELGLNEPLRDQAAGALMGLDVQLCRSLKVPSHSVAFDPLGKKLLIAGLENHGPQLLDGDHPRLKKLQGSGEGPVAFFKGRLPVEWVRKTSNTLALWDLEKGKAIRAFQIPSPLDTLAPKGTETVLEMTPDGSRLAASIPLKENKGVVAIWDGFNGKLLKTFAARATSLAISTDGKLLAVGQKHGKIAVWSIPEGNEVAKLQSNNRLTVLALAFGRNPRHRLADPLPKAQLPTWFLAAGYKGGTVNVWDMQTKLPISFCRSACHQVFDLAFSPDGSTLASASRYCVYLWDFRLGKRLLEVRSGHYPLGLTFSSDGSHLAVCKKAGFGGVPGGVEVWKVKNGHGIQTLRGLTGPVDRVIVSPDEKRIAAFTQAWEVAVWEQDTGNLLSLVNVPEGSYSDNATLRFSPDAQQLVYSVGHRRQGYARKWDARTGQLIDAWTLPPGLQNRVAFTNKGELLHFQVETADGKRLPDSDSPWEKEPRVCRIRALKPKGKKLAIATLTKFNRSVRHALVAPDGKYFVITGFGGKHKKRRWIQAVTETGEVIWTLPSKNTGPDGLFVMDITGKQLALSPENNDSVTVVQMPSGRFLRRWAKLPRAFHWKTGYRCENGGIPVLGCRLFDLDSTTPLVNLGIDENSSQSEFEFSTSGNLLCWGTRYGSVLVFDLPKIRQKLASVGLDWSSESE